MRNIFITSKDLSVPVKRISEQKTLKNKYAAHYVVFLFRINRSKFASHAFQSKLHILELFPGRLPVLKHAQEFFNFSSQFFLD